MLRVQLRRSRAENYFLQTSLGLFSSKQKHTVPGSKAHGLVRMRKERNKMKVAGTGLRNIENVSFRAHVCARVATRKRKEKKEKYIFALLSWHPSVTRFPSKIIVIHFTLLARVLSPSFVPSLPPSKQA